MSAEAHQSAPKRLLLPPGTRIADYRIEDVLGDGGFGITYRARDVLLRTDVALKEYFPLNVAVRRDDGTVEAISPERQGVYAHGLKRFLEEARLLASFSHPNIVSVLRFVNQLGTGYIAMEYVEGEALVQRFDSVGDAGMEQSEVLDILEPLIDGLEHLHKSGIIHRDVKPENIFIRADGTPVLIDFGGARDFETSEGWDLSMLVSPNYTPIEQYVKKGAPQKYAQGPWSDVYSLAAVAFAMVSLLRPVAAGERLEGKRYQSVRTVAKRAYHSALLDAIDGALALEPGNRPQDFGAFHDAIAVARAAGHE